MKIVLARQKERERERERQRVSERERERERERDKRPNGSSFFYVLIFRAGRGIGKPFFTLNRRRRKVFSLSRGIES